MTEIYVLHFQLSGNSFRNIVDMTEISRSTYSAVNFDQLFPMTGVYFVPAEMTQLDPGIIKDIIY